MHRASDEFFSAAAFSAHQDAAVGFRDRERCFSFSLSITGAFANQFSRVGVSFGESVSPQLSSNHV